MVAISKNERLRILLKYLEDLTYKRPGSGISPLHWDKVIGMRTINNLETDHILKWSDITEKEVK